MYEHDITEELKEYKKANEPDFFMQKKTKRVMIIVIVVCISLCVMGLTHLAAYPTSAVVMIALFQYPVIIKNKWGTKNASINIDFSRSATPFRCGKF